MDSYVLDTNIFFNLEIKSGLGKNPTEIIKEVTRIAKVLKANKSGEFYMPPRIMDEFTSFVDVKDEYIKDFLGVVTVKSPNIHELSFHADIFYKLVEEMRHRSYRGLQVAEEEMLKANKANISEEALGKVEYQKAIGKHVSKLRDHYRQATRFRFLDSVADLDLIMLAKEVDGYIVTSDEGVTRWSRIFGIKEIVPQALKERFSEV